MLTLQYRNIHRFFTETSTVVNARGALNVYSFGYLPKTPSFKKGENEVTDGCY